jgi:hypothetical protein
VAGMMKMGPKRDDSLVGDLGDDETKKRQEE